MSSIELPVLRSYSPDLDDVVGKLTIDEKYAADIAKLADRGVLISFKLGIVVSQNSDGKTEERIKFVIVKPEPFAPDGGCQA